MSTLLARPLLIDRNDVTAELPSLAMEHYPTSPLMHMKLQSELVQIVFKKFGSPKALDSPEKALAYKDVLQTWMDGFPPAYAFVNTDIHQEVIYPWIALHRHYVHTIALSMTLGPLRTYMAKHLTRASPPVELEAREEGITYALRLMGAVHSFFDYVWNRDTTFHFVPFCIFDTAALLTSVLLHDKDHSISRRTEVLHAIDMALFTLRKLTFVTSTAKTPYGILRRLAMKLPGKGRGLPHLHVKKDANKRVKREAPPSSRSGGSSPDPPSQSDYDSAISVGPTSASSPYAIDSATGAVMVAAVVSSSGATAGEPIIIEAPPAPMTPVAPPPPALGYNIHHEHPTHVSSLNSGQYANGVNYNMQNHGAFDGGVNAYAQYAQTTQPPPQVQYIYDTGPPATGYANGHVVASHGLPVNSHFQTTHHGNGHFPPQMTPVTAAEQYRQQAMETEQLVQGMNYGDEPINFRPADLGDLGTMWNYEVLDLDLAPNQMM